MNCLLKVQAIVAGNVLMLLGTEYLLSATKAPRHLLSYDQIMTRPFPGKDTVSCLLSHFHRHYFAKDVDPKKKSSNIQSQFAIMIKMVPLLIQRTAVLHLLYAS